MTTPPGPVADPRAAMDAMAELVDGADLAAASPCEGWSVGDVVEHVIAGNLTLVTAFGAASDEVGPDDMAGRLRGSSAALVHGRDVATATGRETSGSPDDAAEACLSFAYATPRRVREPWPGGGCPAGPRSGWTTPPRPSTASPPCSAARPGDHGFASSAR